MTRSASRRDVLRGVVGVGLVGAVGRTSAQQIDRSQQWPQYGLDAMNTGHAGAHTVPRTPVGRKWLTTFEAPDALSSPVLPETAPVVDGTVYAGGPDLVALRATDGAEQWRAGIGSVDATPAVSNGVVVVGGGDEAYGLNAADGSERWRQPTGTAATEDPPTVAGESVYVPGNDLLKFDVREGTKQWQFGPSGFPKTPAVADGRVFAPDDLGNLYVRSADDGSELWTYEGRAGERMEPPSVADGTVYVSVAGSDAGVVIAFDAATGSEAWRYFGFGEDFTAATPAGDAVYFGNGQGKLFAVDRADGKERWSVQVGGTSGRPVVANVTVLVGGGDALVAVDAQSGREQWRVPLREPNAPAVVDGVIYVTTDRGVAALAHGYQSTETTTATATRTATRTRTATDSRTATTEGGDGSGSRSTTEETTTNSGGGAGGFGVLGAVAGATGALAVRRRLSGDD